MAKILIVEDNPMNRDMLSRRLIRSGHSVLMADDGRLMDMSLPEIDGWEATRRLKSDKLTRRIPVIALTAHAMSSDRQRCMEAGCDDYDTKPVDFQRLTAKIQAALQAGTS